MGRDFRKLIVWQRADDLVVEIYRITEVRFPKQERFGLTAQLRSAAVSVPASIAEGSGRGSQKDYLRFLYYAQGSCSEVEYYLHLAHRLGYINGTEVDALEAKRSEVGRTLRGLIASLERT